MAITTLYRPDFVFEPRTRTFKAVKDNLAFPAAKSIGDEFIMKDCEGKDRKFVFVKTTMAVSFYEEADTDELRPFRVAITHKK